MSYARHLAHGISLELTEDRLLVPVEVRKGFKNSFPVLRLGLALLQLEEKLQVALLQPVIGTHALLCSSNACKAQD